MLYDTKRTGLSGGDHTAPGGALRGVLLAYLMSAKNPAPNAKINNRMRMELRLGKVSPSKRPRGL
jgi:hypothetical protein